MDCQEFLTNITYRSLSGWGPNQFGNYWTCNRKSFNYGLYILKNEPLTLIGLCYPDECHTDKLIDPDTYYPNKGGLFYFTIVLISIGVLLSIIRPLCTMIAKYSRGQSTESNEIKQSYRTNLRKAQYAQIYICSFNIFECYDFVYRQISRTKQVFVAPRLIAYALTLYGVTFYFLGSQAPNTVNYSFMGRALYAGDIFLYISGFMLAKAQLRKQNQQIISNAPTRYWYSWSVLMRLLRVYPLYFMTFMIFTQIIPHLGYGPRWPIQVLSSQCDFWMNALLIGNMFDSNTTCQLQTWYISTDFQLFLLGLWSIYLYIRKGTKKFIIISLIISFVLNLSVSLILQFKLSVAIEKNQFDQYIKPWARAPIYLSGILIGIEYMEYRTNNGIENIFTKYKEFQIKYKFIAQMATYLLGYMLIALTVCIPQIKPYEWPIMIQSVWWSVSPFLLILGLQLTLLPGLISDENPPLLQRIGSYLTFSNSQCTLMVILLFGYTYQQSYYFSSEMGLLIMLYSGFLITLVGFALSLLIEVPYMQCRQIIQQYMEHKYKSEQLM